VNSLLGQHCIGDGKNLNHVRVGGYALAFWIGISNIVSLALNDPTNSLPLRLACAAPLFGLAAVSLSVYVSRYAERRMLHYVTWLARHPAQHWPSLSLPEVQAFRTAAKHLRRLTLSPVMQSQLCSAHARTCMTLLSGPLHTADDQVFVYVTQALANMSSNTLCRVPIVQAGVLPYLLRLLHPSLPANTQKIALCVLENLSIDSDSDVCRPLLTAKCVSSLLALLSSREPGLPSASLRVLAQLAGVPGNDTNVDQFILQVPALDFILCSLASPDRGVQAGVLEVLLALATRRTAHSSRDVFLSAISRGHAGQLISALRSPDPTVREWAKKCLELPLIAGAVQASTFAANASPSPPGDPREIHSTLKLTPPLSGSYSSIEKITDPALVKAASRQGRMAEVAGSLNGELGGGSHPQREKDRGDRSGGLPARFRPAFLGNGAATPTPASASSAAGDTERGYTGHAPLTQPLLAVVGGVSDISNSSRSKNDDDERGGISGAVRVTVVNSAPGATRSSSGVSTRRTVRRGEQRDVNSLPRDRSLVCSYP
jgi:hypothetical protein